MSLSFSVMVIASVEMPAITPRLGEFGTHLGFGTRVAEGLTASADAGAFAVAVHADQHEPITHRRDDRMRFLPGGGDCPDDDNAAFPVQRLPAVGAELANPTAVEDLTKCR